MLSIYIALFNNIILYYLLIENYLYDVFFFVVVVVPSLVSYVDEMPVKLRVVLQTLNSLYPHH